MSYAMEEQPVQEAMLRTEINCLEQKNDLSADQTELRGKMLRWAKQRFSLLWSMADLSGTLDFQTLSVLQSRFAEKTIESAFDIAWHSEQTLKLFPDARKTLPTEAGIFILGLGKLGGNDLNFSSDVDLIAFFDKDLLKVAPMHGVSHAVSTCLTQMSKILSEPTKDGFVWRVDWRLRPHASLRSLSMISEKALGFYHYHARPWHRLAMLKARPIAGNKKLAKEFLADLYPFLWRHDLDYRAIDDIAQLKLKINDEHPALAAQRSNKEKEIELGQGFNLKLGHGGIREIEFIANTLQLIWGGRKPALRVSNTLAALRAIEQEALLDPLQVDQLSSAYIFLRKAENRLQMMENQQAYYLPAKSARIAQYLTLYGREDWPEFNRLLSEHRAKVTAIFEDFFEDERDSIAQSNTYVWQQVKLSDTAKMIVDIWQEGFQPYGVSAGQAHLFEPLLNSLSDEIKRSGCALDTAVKAIDEYFKRLPPGGQYFRLLRDYPWLLQKVIAPLLLSPTMANLLTQSPHIIDRFLEESSGEAAALDTTIVFASDDYETRLQNLRRLTNEELYLRYSQYFEGKFTPENFQQSLSHLAEQLLAAALKIACDEMALTKPPIAVIGFGKLGTAGMMPKSDLDLVYLCQSIDDHVLASNFATKLNTIINTPMREGRVYELDTRLRPSGRSGSVTISVDSYRHHQHDRALTWSHLALVPAKFVAGDVKIGEQFHLIKAEILSRPRELHQFKMDCAKMLQRVRKQRIVTVATDQFNVKLRPGGLFELEYLLYCLIIVDSMAQPDNAALGFNAMLDAMVKQRDDGLGEALEFLRVLQLEIRLFGHDDVKFTELPAPILEHVLNATSCTTLEALIHKIEKSVALTTEALDQFFSNVDWESLGDWRESQIHWLKELEID